VIRELAHFAAHAPSTFALSRRLPHAELYETLMLRADAAGLGDERRALVAGLEGSVLEIGCGTGLMFPYYAPSVTLTAIERDPSFLALAVAKAAAAPCAIELIEADATSLPFEDARFDAVVLALVLCSVTDVPRLLGEAHRVLRPGGALRALEHVRSANRVAGALMHLFDPIWLTMNGQGCHMDRDAESAIARAGFLIEESRPLQTFARGLPAFPQRRIHARKLLRK
jgi:ubiquinone/menaquinone biosynthesis C-methylase UbiE